MEFKHTLLAIIVFSYFFPLFVHWKKCLNVIVHDNYHFNTFFW